VARCPLVASTGRFIPHRAMKGVYCTRSVLVLLGTCFSCIRKRNQLMNSRHTCCSACSVLNSINHTSRACATPFIITQLKECNVRTGHLLRCSNMRFVYRAATRKKKHYSARCIRRALCLASSEQRSCASGINIVNIGR
jgi:hypothetical protein